MSGPGHIAPASIRPRRSRAPRRVTASPVRRAAGLIGRILAWTVILGLIALLIVSVAIPRLVGGQAYTVLTGSMRPGLPPGTMVVTRPVDPADVGVGTVITYQRESGRPDVVTHRVVAQGFDSSGEPIWWTQGDANDVRDEKPVRPVQVRGKVWYSLSYVGYAGTLVPGGVRGLGVWAAVVTLVGYALVMFVGAARDRRGRSE